MGKERNYNMVYLFVGGLFLGLPVGCWMREKNYHARFIKAYHVIVPPQEAPAIDKFRDTRKEFYEDLKKGKVENKDFERYVYGGFENKRKDDRDVEEQKEFEEKKKIERDVKNYIQNQQLYNK